MLNRVYPFIGVLLSFVLFAGCQGDKASKGEVLAEFSGGKITDVDLTSAMDRLPDPTREVALLKKKEFLTSYASEKILLQEAEKRGYEKNAEVQEVMKEARDGLLVAKLIDEEVNKPASVTEDEIKSYYEAHAQEYQTAYKLRASHILVKTREEADAILLKLQNGEGTFEALAQENSLDPTRAKGGDIGYFEKGQLIPEIEEVAFGLKEGELSEVVESPFGFHILKVTGETKPEQKDFESVKEEIKEQLVLNKKSKLFNDLMENLKQQSNLKIHDEKLNEFKYNNSTTETQAPSATAPQTGL